MLPIFYEQLFHSKVVCAPLMYLQFGFVIFWRKDFGAKAAHKMLVKLTQVSLFFLLPVASGPGVDAEPGKCRSHECVRHGGHQVGASGMGI
jgi:hypothetical protein